MENTMEKIRKVKKEKLKKPHNLINKTNKYKLMNSM
jgi:hypothetical protein